ADIAAGAAAKAELAITGPATAAGTLALLVNGVSVQVGVSADDTADTIATASITAVNKLPDTQVTAALKAGSTTIVTLTTNWKGATGNAMD
ncbi:phage tail protein, partial [Acinetobacter baumannii]|nr:phage tail protein [Acinetobacter baumannii]